jgi:hypothetical protein
MFLRLCGCSKRKVFAHWREYINCFSNYKSMCKILYVRLLSEQATINR